MTTATNKGRNLREELNNANYCEPYIEFGRLGDVSLLMRKAARYATRQEQACTYEWACGEKWDRDEQRLEASIRELACSLPGIEGVEFSGDPRGYCVRLILTSGRSNHLGGDTWGIA